MKKSALMLLMLAVAGCSAEKAEKKAEIAKPVKTVTLGEANTETKLSFPGKVIAGKEANITFKVSGKLNKLPIKEGQQIKKGDLIAQLDQKDYKFAYEKQLANFEENKSSFARAQELIKNKYISQADFDKKKKAFDVAKADLNIAKTNLDYTTLQAPFDGKVAKVYANNFQNVQAKENIIMLQNLDYLEVKIFVPERIVINSKSPEGVRTFVRFDANSTKQYPAEMTEIATQADSLTQTYEVTVKLPSPTDINVLPGMTALVEAYSQNKNASESTNYSVPADSIFSDNEQNTFVWVVNAENRVEKRQVKTKSFNAQDVEIESGLQSGDTVVTAGVNFLRDNQLVKNY